MDIVKYNRDAWNREVEKGNRWTIPVGMEVIVKARRGEWSIVLTPNKLVPQDWFPDLENLDVLCLASGGGQQGPILAGAGAKVTVLDNSPKQLEQDRLVAVREPLAINILEGDMTDILPFPSEHFSLIVHPVSNIFIEDIQPVWNECFRVLKRGGLLLSGLTNPAVYLFDAKLADEQGILQVKYSLPYSDILSLNEKEIKQLIEQEEPLEFSHTLEELIGGQLSAGLVITDFYEDSCTHEDNDLLSKYMRSFFATRAMKL
ncbi:class I SAM-dependent methyltransferase [Chloroflexota bacterium]